MPSYTHGRSQGRNPHRRYHGKYVTKGYLRAIVGTPESKWLNTTVTAASVLSAPSSVYNLNFVPQGTDQSSRIGDEVTNKSIHMRLDLTRTAVDSIVRVIIFWFMDGTAEVTPTPATILETVDYRSPLNKNFGKSFWVKFDKTYTLTAGNLSIQVDEIWRRCKCKTEFNTSAGGLITANSLHMLVISNQTVLANQPLLSFTSRVTYLDV